MSPEEIENRLAYLEGWRRGVDERLGRIIKELEEISQGFMSLNHTETMILEQLRQVLNGMDELGPFPVRKEKGS